MRADAKFACVGLEAAEVASLQEGLPTVMRLWFAAVAQCDFQGVARFDSHELELILGVSDRTVRGALRSLKNAGMIGRESSAREVHLLGADNRTGVARRLSEKRHREAIGRRYSGPARPRLQVQ